jgi:hypothetical protein
MRLGEGWGVGLSGDAGWAVLAADPSDFSQLTLVPTSVGEAFRIDTRPLKPSVGLWHVDGNRVGFNGAEPGRPPRAFLFERSTGRSRAVTPENTRAIRGLVRDEQVLALAQDGSLAFHPIAGGEGQPVPARLPADLQTFSPNLQVVRVSGDGRSLFVKEGSIPARIERLELATGRRTPWKILKPADPAGVYGTWAHHLTPDGEGYVYAYGRALTDIYLLEGLQF